MKRLIKHLFLIFNSLLSFAVLAQVDEDGIRQIFEKELREGNAYQWLEELSTKVGPRLSGSSGAKLAVEWAKRELEPVSDSVWLQPVMVPQWVRGQKEIARIKKSKSELNVCALGGSVGTGPGGVTGEVVEVKSLEELKQLGEKEIRGKIVFFNRPMDPARIHTFAAYGGAVDQRGSGPSEAARFGAIGAIVRSMGLNLEDYPHTGGLIYDVSLPKIPAVAISTKHADLLSRSLKDNKHLQFYFETHCETLPDVESFNVIGELKGSEYSDEIIVVSGHLDSWDLGQGAHDDGAGVVHSMEVLRLFKVLGIKPKRTIRVVLFMNEENGLRGGIEYARQVELKKEKHVAAIESDRGGFTPRGFSMSCKESVRERIKSWKPLLEGYGLTDFDQEGGGADIGPLSPFGVPLIGFLPDSQRYFDYHHTAVDTIDKVSKRELELGAASITALVYLIDKHGLE
ncbi:MAG TPA: M20/M25/M40 family metallo-hydrolase [Chryseolinea sp.]|nr:M20/M25/M40 family metallo-hydrolase [Chryseolinea sp.]